jgi:galactokinase
MSLIENFPDILKKLYGTNEEALKKQIGRYNSLFDMYNDHFTDQDVYLFSSPGRTEIGGNHTDHNFGRVIAASVNLDSVAIVSKIDSQKIMFYSDGYDEFFEVDLKELDKIVEEEGTTNSLIRGIAARFIQLGYNIGSFCGVITSDVLPGSGLSSSASVEVLIGSIFNVLFNNGEICSEELAIIGQYAENNYFGKPCGLMDQMACAVGGIIAIDFKDPNNPVVEKVKFDFDSHKYKLMIVDTGGNHEDLTEDYSSIPTEMKSVAKFFGMEVCRELDYNTFLSRLTDMRLKTGDRAALRAFHFILENERVVKQMDSLRENNFDEFLKYIKDSGDSSFKWLQNIFSTKNVQEQGVTLALAFSEKFISDKGEGACRVHGGGFAGTIQVFMPDKFVEEYKNYIEEVIGKGKVMILNIRSEGSVCLNNLY